MVVEKVVTITNRTGLHARPAALFVKAASGFKSSIRVILDGREADAKSILGVMALGVRQNSQIRLRAEGEDAENALETLRALIAGGFGES
ncbi:MAG: HPr family phosphocarrier protein [Firmicutes bacterium]|nr:HPr family phosphocarrier protein [Bacillota bacterium]MCL5039726.1 HPr family phosphocarrier protein [Bacillota bacterium]